MKIVKNIHDIPGIETFLNDRCVFRVYDTDSRIRTYETLTDLRQVVEINIISEEQLMFQYEKLTDLITQEGIGFFEWRVFGVGKEVLVHYVYRS